MRKFCRLFSDGLGYFWPTMSNIHHSDATGKIDKTISIDILDNCTVRAGSKNIHRRRDTTCDKLLPSR
jgi:hypothetical protein